MSQIKFHGLSTFELVTEKNRRILIDPVFEENRASATQTSELREVELMLISSAQRMGDAAKIASRTGAAVVCGAEVREQLVEQGVAREQITVVQWGTRAEVRGIRIQALESHAPSFGKRGEALFAGFALAFVIQVGENERFYHGGGTVLFSDLKLQGELYKPQIGTVQIAGLAQDWNATAEAKVLSEGMSPVEAALAAQWLGLSLVIPCGFTNPNCSEVVEFQKSLEQAGALGGQIPQSVAMKPGDIFKFQHS